MKEVSVAVDGEEARISFVDHMHGEMSVRERCKMQKITQKCYISVRPPASSLEN